MTSMKKVEIVIDALEASAVTALLDKVGVTGYTVVGQVSGKGSRRDRSSDDLAGSAKNCYVFAACPEAHARAVGDAVRPMLRRLGGICLVTDCLWVEH